MLLHSLAKRLRSLAKLRFMRNVVFIRKITSYYFHYKSFASVRKHFLGERKCFAIEIKRVATDR